MTCTNKKILFTLCVCIGCFFVKPSAAQQGEINLLNAINPNNGYNSFFKTSSQSVYPLTIASTAGILLNGLINKDKQLQEKGWQLAGSVIVSAAITQTFKYSINRNRPYQDYSTLIVAYGEKENGKSFPSGHTSTAFATATSVSINFKKWYIVLPAFAWASIVAYSRLHLGQHYPSDVVAGAAVGTGSALLSRWLSKKIFAKK